MKISDKSVNQSFDYLTLYKEQLQEIYSALHELSNEVVFTIENYSLENFAEIDEVAKEVEKVKNVTISTRTPYISFSTSTLGCSMYYTTSTYYQKTVIEGVCVQLRKSPFRMHKLGMR